MARFRKAKGFYTDKQGKVRPITASTGKHQQVLNIRIPAHLRKKVEASFQKREQEIKKEQQAPQESHPKPSEIPKTPEPESEQIPAPIKNEPKPPQGPSSPEVPEAKS